MKESAVPANRPAVRFRNGFADTEAVPFDTVVEGSDRREPLATIAIPTFKRPGFLTEAVESALAQVFDRPYEIVIVDNDPESQCAELLLNRFPELRERNFRYIINRENIGAWGNFNRCIQMARGQWLTFLQDDDLLDSNYLQLMFASIDEDPSIDGIVCRKRAFRDDSDPADREEQHSALWNQRMSPRLIMTYLVHGSARRELFRRVRTRLQFEYLFGRKATRSVSPRTFFWGPVLGNHGGFICRTRAAIDIGGFYAEDSVAGDQWFWIRFTSRYSLRQHREVAASIRIADNWSSAPGAHLSGMQQLRDLQLALIGTWVPRSWRVFAPLILSRYDAGFQEGLRLNVPRAEIEQVLGAKLPKDRPRLLALIRFVLGGSHPA